MLTKFKPKDTAASTLLDNARIRKGSAYTDLRRNATAFEEYKGACQIAKKIAAEQRIELDIPPFTGDLQQAFEQLAAAFVKEKFGRVTDLPDGNVEYYWYETLKEGGLWKNKYTTTKHTHVIAQRTVKYHRLPYSGWMPANVRRIHDDVCSAEVLRKSVRMMTGFLVQEGAQVDAVAEEHTRVAKATIAAGNALKNAAGAIAAGAAAIGSMAAAAAAPVAVVAAGDPALILGRDVVLTGFKEQD